jgi:hypothetical protein
MKRFLLITLTFSVLAFTACEESDLSINFNLTQGDIAFTLSADKVINSNGEAIDISTPSQTTLTGEMENYADQLDKLESAKLQTLKVSIISPATQKFSFVNEVKFYISGNGIEETLVGSKSDIDPTASVVELDINDLDLVEYIRSGEVSTRVSFTTTDTIDDDCDMIAEMTYQVTAAVL